MSTKKKIWDFIDTHLDDEYLFLIRPWKKDYEEFYKQLVSFWNNNTIKVGYPKIEDADSLHIQYLNTDLKKAIEDSSLVLIDISLGLPNVFWEFGIAIAAGKPVILLRKSKTDEKSSLKRVIKAAYDVLNRKSDKKTLENIDKIVERTFEIPADIAGVVYNNYEIDKVEDTINKIINKYESAFKHACEMYQVNFIRPLQFQNYFEQNKQQDRIVYFRYDNTRDVKLIEKLTSFLDRISTNLNLENNFKYFILSIKEENGIDDFHIDQSLIKSLIKNHQNIAITNQEIENKILIQLNDKAYFTFSENNIVYNCSEDNISFLINLKTEFAKSFIRLESSYIFNHAYKLMNSYGKEDISEIHKSGFKFDSYSKLWIESPEVIIKQIKPYGCKTNIIKELQKKITEDFNNFAIQYIDDEIKYILAIWPLDEAGLELADTNVKNWIEKLNNWYESGKGTIDRFFIIPYRAGQIIVKNKDWHFEDSQFKERFITFFKRDFELDKCKYPDRLFIIIKNSDILTRIFPHSRDIINQNAILFSKSNRKDDLFRGILQCQEKIILPYNLEDTGSFLLNFVFWKLSNNNYDTNSKVSRYLDQITALKNLVSNDAKIDHLVNAPQYIKVKDFINS